MDPRDLADEQVGRALQAEACTSSAPKLETPTSVTQTGFVRHGADLVDFGGHSWICHRFQSSGKPCTATTSTWSSTPLSSDCA